LPTHKTSAAPDEPLPDEAGEVSDVYQEHDSRIRRFHDTGLVPAEIAVVLNSQRLRVKTWAINETFVRNRLTGMGLKPHCSRTLYVQGLNSYRLRPKHDPE
jgi:hypothetical protein